MSATHYTGTAAEIAYGTELAAALGRAGFPGRRFVIDADNGRPFTWNEYWAKHPNGDFHNAEECRTRSERRCVSLGIPPTSAVGAAGELAGDHLLYRLPSRLPSVGGRKSEPGRG